MRKDACMGFPPPIPAPHSKTVSYLNNSLHKALNNETSDLFAEEGGEGAIVSPKMPPKRLSCTVCKVGLQSPNQPSHFPLKAKWPVTWCPANSYDMSRI
jgi:hypothetical protein